MKSGLITIVLAYVMVAAAGAPQNRPSNAAQLLSDVKQVYERARTYSDIVRGEREAWQGEEKQWSDPCLFRTDFVRPQSVRFEAQCKRAFNDDYSVVLENQGNAQLITVEPTGNKVEKIRNFDAALPAASGFSIGYGPTIAKLLMPALSSNALLPLTAPQLRSDEKIGEVPVYVVAGEWRGSSVVLKIHKEQLLILEMQNIDKFSTFETRTTYHIEPSVNTEIPQDRFRIEPLGFEGRILPN